MRRVQVAAFGVRVIGCAAALVLLQGCTETNSTAQTPAANSERSYADLTPTEKLAEEVGRPNVSPDQLAKAEKAARAAFTNPSKVVIESIYGMEFGGQPTVCGQLRSKPGASLQRFMFRNGNALVEKDVSAENFQMFWRVCETLRR